MQQRVLCATLVLLLAGPGVLFAQKTERGKGQFGTRISSIQQTELPDGRMIQVNHYSQVTFADNPNHPLNNNTSDCVGLFMMSADGNPMSASGTCFSKNSAGDGASFWWRMDKAGTADCPNSCGSWGYFAGYGKYAGITGNGTWRVTAPFEEGNLGTWEGSVTMK